MRPFALASVALFLGSGSANSQTTPARWSLASVPLVSIGANGEDTLILGATSATRLSSGDIVVASSKNARVLWFNPKGDLLRAVGRKGRGPGEFGSDIHLTRLPGDSVVVHDGNNRRFTYIDPAGTVIRIDQVGETRRSAWLYNRILLEHIPGEVSFGQLQTTVARIPFARGDTLRLGRVTSDGMVWVRNHPSSTRYEIFARSGAVAGVVDLPDGFDPWEITVTTVLGRWLDQDDVEHIELRALIAPRGIQEGRIPASSQEPYDQAAELARQGALVGSMRAVLRNILTANEAFYAGNRRYARTVSELGASQAIVSTGVQVTFVWADGQSYAALARHASTPIACVIVLMPSTLVSSNLVCG